MPQVAVLDVLKDSYRAQGAWLLASATELESGNARVLRRVEGNELDVSAETAIDYRHRAANLEIIIQSYNRLNAKGS